MIGNVELDNDEIELLKLPPKFAIRKKLESVDMEVDGELCMAKVRYQVNKEKNIMEIENDENDELNVKSKRKRLNSEERKDLELSEKLDSEARRFYDPIAKVFDHGKKRATDLPENSKVNLPKPCDAATESSIELMKTKIMEVFRKYRAEHCNERNEQRSNLNKKEQRGLRKLRKKI